MAKTFEELVQSSSRIVKKEWSSPSELAQELYSLLANSGVSSSYGTASKLITPVYAEVSTTPKSVYPENVESFKDDSRVDFHGLKNPTDPNYPEVPPISVKKKLNMVDPVSTGVAGGATNGAITNGINASIAYGSVVSSNGADHDIPGRVDIQVIYSGTSSVLLKNVKVLNANSSFKVPIGTETIVFFSAYALFPVWL